MKKLATFVLLAILCVSYSLPALAKTHKTHNKYKGIDKASQRAQEREQKAIDKYAKRQQKAERKMLKREKKKSTHRPKNPW